MPTISEIPTVGSEDLTLVEMKWLNEVTRVLKGGIYLIAGDPGSGKTTLSLQLALDIARSGTKVLYLTTEQSPSDLKSVALRLLGGEVPKEVDRNLFLEVLTSLGDLRLWRSHLFEEYSPSQFRDTKMIVIDSIQGGGLAPGARRAYEELAKFTRIAKNKGVTSLLVSHVTKAGMIAGPKDIEHHVDCILQYRRAFRLRPLFVPKNRFGPTKLDPFILEMDKLGLRPSPHTTPKVSTVQGVSFVSKSVARIQARVQVPRWGERPSIKAPYLPREKLHHIISAVCQIPGLDASELMYQIDCYMPGVDASGVKYRFEFDLAIAVSVLSSYLQHEVLQECGFCGEVDLGGGIRANFEPVRFEPRLKEALEIGSVGSARAEVDLGPIVKSDFLRKLEGIRRLFVPDEVKEDVTSYLNTAGLKLDIVGVSRLQDLLGVLWPDVVEGEN